MRWRKLSSILSSFVTFDENEKSQNKAAHLKRKLLEERKALGTRSSVLGEVLSSQFAQDLNASQKRRLNLIKVKTDSCIESLCVLEKELEEKNKAARSKFRQALLTRRTLVLVLLLPPLISSMFDAARHDWVLAGSTLFLTGLYVYIYKFVENKFLLPAHHSFVINKRLFRLFIYLSRWVFFLIFVFLETIVMIDWGLLKTESAPALTVPFMLAFLAAIYLELANIQKAFSFRIKWPKSQISRSIAYVVYLCLVLLVFMYIIVLTFYVGTQLFDPATPLGKFLQELASSAIIASMVAASINIYFVKIRGIFSKA